MIFTVSTILAISSISCVDFLIILLLLYGPLATRLKKLSLGFGSLNAYVSECEKIGHHSRLLYGDLLHSLDVADSIVEGIDELDVLDIWDALLALQKCFM
jgi:hypothetical protein